MEKQYSQALADFPKRVTDSVDTPCFIVSEMALRRNLEVLKGVRERTGAKVLLALKAFAMFSTFPLVRRYMDGVCASGPMEARLGREEFGKEVHTYAPAYSGSDMAGVIRYSDVIIFNSMAQWKRHRGAIRSSGKRIGIGLRVNPGRSSVKADLYNPTLPGSRLGMLPGNLAGADLSGIEGLHFHALCEQGAEELVHVMRQFEKSYGRYISKMKWINIGGGHHITRKGYNVDLLVKTVNRIKGEYGVQVHIEPGEAVALNAGVLVSTVLDIVHNDLDIAILDTSAEAHMPDVLAMPYRPEVIGAGKPGELRHRYRLGGMTCLAGDVIGDYSFSKRLNAGERMVFLDMAHYSMVKTTTFNGIRLPGIATYGPNGKVRIIKKFGYGDYKRRLS